MPGLPLALPEPLQAVVEDPEVRVAVLDQELAASRLPGEVEEGQRVAVGQRERLLADCRAEPAASRPIAAAGPCGPPGPGA